MMKKNLDYCKSPPPWEELVNPSDDSSVTSDNSGSECNNEIVTDTEEFYDGIM